MDPQLLSPGQWDYVTRLMISLFFFVGLALNTAFAFLLGHAIIPSLVVNAEAPRAVQGPRWVLYPVFVISLALALYAFWRAISLGVTVLQYLYPRFAI